MNADFVFQFKNCEKIQAVVKKIDYFLTDFIRKGQIILFNLNTDSDILELCG